LSIVETKMSQGDACDECGENMYYERGGFFFCQECNTQSQVMRQIEESTIHYDLSATQIVLSMKRSVKD
jgi:uncharacterized Zn ribbon protein